MAKLLSFAVDDVPGALERTTFNAQHHETFQSQVESSTARR